MIFQVYQFRHCDVTNTAHQVFLAIGVALILEVVGIFYSNWFFWIVFGASYISFVFIFIIQVGFYNNSDHLNPPLLFRFTSTGRAPT